MFVPDNPLPKLATLGYHFTGPITKAAVLEMIEEAKKAKSRDAYELLAHLLLKIDRSDVCDEPIPEMQMQMQLL
jgi:hypothetical protein